MASKKPKLIIKKPKASKTVVPRTKPLKTPQLKKLMNPAQYYKDNPGASPYK